MAKNNELIATTDSAYLGGFANLFFNEIRRWWRTRRWLVNTLIWMLLVNGIVAILLFVAPNQAVQQGAAAAGEVTAALEGLDILSFTVFLSMIGMAPGIGAVIIGQDAMINEKNHGTAAWLLSKPVSRGAFVLAKILANAASMLITMIMIQGAIAYLLIWLGTGTAFPVGLYLGTLGLAFLALLFYLTMTIMLGAFSNSRGLALGVPLLLVLGYQLFGVLGDWVYAIMPWNMTASLGTKPALGLVLLMGQPLPTVLPLIATAAWCVIFTAVALWRFGREEF